MNNKEQSSMQTTLINNECLWKLSVELLTLEKEKELSVKAQQGDIHARNMLISHNLRLVLSIVKHYKNRGMDVLDLISEGNLGLIHAIYKFNPNLNFRFSTYASWWIKQNIEQALMKNFHMVHLPSHMYKKYRSYMKKMHGYPYLNDRQALAKIATKCQSSPILVEKALSLREHLVSINAASTDDGGILLEVLSDPRTPEPFTILQNESICKELEKALAHLSPQQKDVLCYHFGLCGYDYQTVKETSCCLNLSIDKVHHLQRQAIKIMRSVLMTRKIDKNLLH